MRTFCSKYSAKQISEFHKKDILCWACGRNEKRIERDHILAMGLDGEDMLTNLQLLCYDCHKEKTRADMLQMYIKKHGIDIEAVISKATVLMKPTGSMSNPSEAVWQLLAMEELSKDMCEYNEARNIRGRLSKLLGSL